MQKIVCDLSTGEQSIVDLTPEEVAETHNQNTLPTPEQMRKMCSDAIDQHLDAFAQAWGYKTLERAAGYANSTNPKFKAEANALVAWRDAVWEFSEQMDAAILAGIQPAPESVEAFIATLPAAPARPV